MIKLNKQMLKIKLKQDKFLRELKRKEFESEPATKRSSITVGDGKINDTFKITFS